MTLSVGLVLSAELDNGPAPAHSSLPSCLPPFSILSISLEWWRNFKCEQDTHIQNRAVLGEKQQLLPLGEGSHLVNSMLWYEMFFLPHQLPSKDLKAIRNFAMFSPGVPFPRQVLTSFGLQMWKHLSFIQMVISRVSTPFIRSPSLLAHPPLA